MADIELSARCSCGSPLVASETASPRPSHGWCVVCAACYDPVEDATRAESLIGYGATVSEALWAWAEDHEDAHEIEWLPVEPVLARLGAQVAAESERQRNWTVDGNVYGPRASDAAGSEA